VDPSHAPGGGDLVTALSKAAVAMSADGLIVVVDDDPTMTLSDARSNCISASSSRTRLRFGAPRSQKGGSC
jgi:3-deoxy-D-arabino-heptulosonate 7-phosphate (DAHP) synthase